MASIKEWPDGYLLSMDPRREDPLFYYMKRDDWEHAIGLEVLPLYEERAAVEVTISVWAGTETGMRTCCPRRLPTSSYLPAGTSL